MDILLSIVSELFLGPQSSDLKWIDYGLLVEVNEGKDLAKVLINISRQYLAHNLYSNMNEGANCIAQRYGKKAERWT